MSVFYKHSLTQSCKLTKTLAWRLLLSWVTTVKACSLFPQAARGCSRPCSCPPSAPSCALGVSWVLDECGCCKVCAQQFNQDCGPDRPCDHIKGLRCHLGAGGDPRRGLCRGENNTWQLWDCCQNNGCEWVILQLGELFCSLWLFLWLKNIVLKDNL